MFAFSNGAGAGQFFLGFAGAANSPIATNFTALTTNTDYRVYLRYTLNSGVAALWINPTNESSSSVAAGDAAAASSIVAFAFREEAGIGDIKADDLRVGTNFNDVYVAPPINPPVITQQPVDVSVVQGGAVTFAVSVLGTPPIWYQWHYNNSPLANATNAMLTLSGVTTNSGGQYWVGITNSAGGTNSAAATLTVLPPNASGLLTLVHYNVKGNFTADWTTNAAQVQAIARQLIYLNPDIITLNEIPNGFRSEMTNWMRAFFPGYNLAISPGTDGVLRSGVISRFPLVRTNSWLLNASLTNFGYNGTFTRDLMETEVTVPGATESLHVFTTHLKSADDADSQQRRAAECSAISNFFATVFLPTNTSKAYLLTGDLNEDINLPMSQNLQAIQRLTNGSGLFLTTPVNPFTLARFTHSIQGAMDARFDYVMPSGLMVSNVVNSQVFRTDLLPPPLPPNLNSNDDIVASDHLPVVTVFRYPDPALVSQLSISNQTVKLTWPALVSRKFAILTSSNLITWTTSASNLVAATTTVTWSAPVTNSVWYFRVVRTP